MEAIESRAITFLHRKALLAYQGNGHGISDIVIQATKQSPFRWWQEAMFGEAGRAIDLQLQHMCPFIQKRERVKIVTAIMRNTQQLNYDPAFFIKHIRQESYTDILSNPQLSAFVTHSERSASQMVDLARLKGAQPNKLRVLKDVGSIRDAVDLVLQIAEINLEVVMSSFHGECDLFTPMGAERLLQAKLARAGATSSALENFLRLLDLNDIPDIGVAVEAGDRSLSDIWCIRKEKASIRFREWLRQADTGDASELEKAYVESLGQPSIYNRLPTRIMRFVITAGISTGVALTYPAAGIAAGIAINLVDSFFVEKWLRGYSPRLFLDRLSELPQQ